MDAREWKAFYESERRRLGDRGLEDLLSRAPTPAWPAGAALIFPHTRLVESGVYTAAVARAVVASSADRVLALGVLHQARREDADEVARARAGDEGALHRLRKVHGPGVPDDAGHWADEYSLDNFVALVEAAARVAGKKAPQIVHRFPFLVGDAPSTLPGIDELRDLARSSFVVATTDPVHHGAGYGTPPQQQRERELPETAAFARSCIESAFALLARGDFAAFAKSAAADRSDFRDNGPVLATLLGAPAAPLSFDVKDVTLVDYAETLNAATPTWVAATLSAFWT